MNALKAGALLHRTALCSSLSLLFSFEPAGFIFQTHHFTKFLWRSKVMGLELPVSNWCILKHLTPLLTFSFLKFFPVMTLLTIFSPVASYHSYHALHSLILRFLFLNVSIPQDFSIYFIWSLSCKYKLITSCFCFYCRNLSWAPNLYF